MSTTRRRARAARPGSSIRIALLTLLCASASLLPAAPLQSDWELTLTWRNDGTVSLLAADPLPATPKPVRSPGARGALHSLPVTIDWLGPGGEVLSTGNASLPLGTRTPVQEGSTERGLVLPEETVVLRLPGPGPDQQVAGVRVRKQIGAPPALNLPLSDNGVLPIPAGDEPQPDPVAVPTKIQDTGDDANRFVLVILGDGYTQAEIDDGTFSADVAAVVAEFASVPPWDDMMTATNIYQVSYPSVQSGADYEDGPPGGGGTLKNTYYQTSFYVGGIERLLAPSSTGRSRCIAVANNYVGLGAWDQIVLIVNSSKYGGSGGSIATNSMNMAGPAISVHEVGHSFAGLGDEYDYNDGATYSGATPGEPNVDTDPTSPKWSHWIEPGTPLPTPDAPFYNTTVGAFEGARYYTNGLFRPWRNCGMRSLNQPFCPVCREEHLRAFFDYVDITDGVNPASGSTVNVTGSATIAISPIAIPDLAYEWRRDGVLLPGADGPVLPLSSASLDAETQEVSLELSYASPMMRLGAPSESFTWTVRNTGETTGGTPHWWLVQHGLGVEDGIDSIDHDGDGQTTGNEFLSNTDPHDRDSLLRISEVLAPGPTTPGRLRWKTEVGRKYLLEVSPDLVGWEEVSGYRGITGDGGVKEYEIPAGSDPALFYRVAARLP